MSKRIEVEEKYFCTNKEGLISTILLQGLTKKSEKIETDEYFTDINGEYVKNRTCLRIRSKNTENAELTFKGKSKTFGHFYAKAESNINFDVKANSEMVSMLSAMGFYSYSVVKKNRLTYTLKEEDITLNVMIDEVEGVGSFVEFEVLGEDSADIENLTEKLNSFVNKFNELNFQNADLPYRDYVAKDIYNKILPQLELKAIMFDLDGTLINSEKIFYESFKEVLFKNYSVKITREEYEENELRQNENLITMLKKTGRLKESFSHEEIMNEVYDNYEIKFKNILSDGDVIANFELIRKIKDAGFKIGLVTTSKRKFIDTLLLSLELENIFDTIVSRESVDSLKPSPNAYLMALESLNIAPEHCIAIEDSARGIQAALSSKIKPIQVTNYSITDKEYENVVKIDSVTRTLLILLNHYRGN